ncbi:RagB/SusD family nutrient uptake outer membrane protein [Niabella sp. W65]|nr:RagB/SusD family nutrient uptake outer membrane protein [Niabella sp. W65]MCH7363898.1 RagB/SusD family nutrient uptake outer membrane protein [Niabella sp. W65]
MYRANEFLLALQNRGSIITDEALRKRYEAEAKFLRAFYYFDLVKIFGRVPVTEKAVSPEEARQLQRSEVSKVYELILQDLQFAADNLPEAYAAADKGRATKFAAKGILALVHLMRSAPTYDIKGPGLGLNEYSQALALLNEIVASGKYTFAPSFPNIFSYTNENNSEVIFDVQYATGFNPVLGATFPWLLAPDTWFQSQGKPTQEAW